MVKTAEGILETGHAIYLFKQSRPKVSGGSDFTALMLEWFGIQQGVATRWTKIGERYDELKQIRFSLPPVDATILEIARLPAEVLTLAVDAGFINTNVTTKQIKQFAKSHKPAPVILEPKVTPPATLEGNFTVIPEGYILESDVIDRLTALDNKLTELEEINKALLEENSQLRSDVDALLAE